MGGKPVKGKEMIPLQDATIKRITPLRVFSTANFDLHSPV